MFGLTVKEFIDSYTEFHMNQRKNQSNLRVLVVRREDGKRIYGDDISCGTMLVRPEHSALPVVSWFFDYKERESILSVPREDEKDG